jgi:hypothetical protein
MKVQPPLHVLSNWQKTDGCVVVRFKEVYRVTCFRRRVPNNAIGKVRR